MKSIYIDSSFREASKYPKHEHDQDKVTSAQNHFANVCLAQDSFKKFVPLKENTIDIHDTYTYDERVKNMSRKVTKTFKIFDYTEDFVMKESILMCNILTDHITKILSSWDLLQASEGNVINMSKTSHDYEEEIKVLKEELGGARHWCGMEASAIGHLQGFIQCELSIEE